MAMSRVVDKIKSLRPKLIKQCRLNIMVKWNILNLNWYLYWKYKYFSQENMLKNIAISRHVWRQMKMSPQHKSSHWMVCHDWWQIRISREHRSSHWLPYHHWGQIPISRQHRSSHWFSIYGAWYKSLGCCILCHKSSHRKSTISMFMMISCNYHVP